MRVDVAVVGASSSGLYAAELLAEGGARVAVFERTQRLDPARRTLIITPEIESLLGPVPGDVKLNTTGELALSAGDRAEQVRLRTPDLIIERGRLARWMADRARSAGAELHLGHRFRSLSQGSRGLRLDFETAAGSKTVRAGALIGADGILSDVGRASGLPRPPVEPLVQAEIELPSGWDPGLTQVWFEPEKTRYFYWLIPESDSRAVVGLIGDGRAGAGALLKSFMARHGFRPLRYQGARVSMHHPGLRPWRSDPDQPIYLVGDAAGQVKVTTVGGTVTGLAGAQAAAAAVLHGIPYHQALRPLQRELDLQWGMRLLLNQLDARGYERLLDCLTPPVKGFLSRHNRDRMFPAIWRLLLQPRMALLGLATLGRLLIAPLNDYYGHEGAFAGQGHFGKSDRGDGEEGLKV